MTDQLTIAEPSTVCPVCGEPWTPEQLGDTDLCTDCFKDDDRSESHMRDVLGDRGRPLPWEEFS